jgi:hypothetical protein
MIIRRTKSEGSAASPPGDFEGQHDSSTLPVCIVAISIVVLPRSPAARAHGAEFFRPSDKFHLGAAIRATQSVFPIRPRVSDLLHNDWP